MTEPRPARYNPRERWEPKLVSQSANQSIRIIGDRLLVRRAAFARPWNGPVELWNAQTGKLIPTLFDQKGLSWYDYDFLGDGRWIYGIDDDGLAAQVFSSADGKPIARLPIPKTESKSRIDELISNPSGRWVIMKVRYQDIKLSWRHRLYVFDAKTWTLDPEASIMDPADCELTSIKYIADDIFSIFRDNMTEDIVWAFYQHGQGLTEPNRRYKYTLLPSRPNSTGQNVASAGGRLFDSWEGTPALTDLTGKFALGNGGRLFDVKTRDPAPLPPGARYHPDLVRFAEDGRFVDLIDTITGKKLPAKMPDNYLPGVGFIGRSGVPVDFGPGQWPEIDPKLLQHWAQVAVRGELGEGGEFVKWDEPTWEKKRQELAAAKPPYPDFPFPGHVAQDKLHWLRKEYEEATENDKLSRATKLLRRAEEMGDKNEAVRWRADVAKRTPELAPLPRERK